MQVKVTIKYKKTKTIVEKRTANIAAWIEYFCGSLFPPIDIKPQSLHDGGVFRRWEMTSLQGLISNAAFRVVHAM